jgi:hypothetical protein
MTKYDYLKQYKVKGGETSTFHISLYQVTDEDIKNAERNVNISFPGALKEFWLEAGCGWFNESITGFRQGSGNYFFDPEQISKVLIYRDEYIEDGFVILDDWSDEMLDKGYFPFFEVQPSEYFFMKLGSDAVYTTGEEIVEEHFEDFIYNLYHIHPGYYRKKMLRKESWEKEGYNIPEVDANWHLGRHRRGR